MPNVDPSLYSVRPAFGCAGGPDEVALTAAGRARVARVATGLPAPAAAALEAVGEGEAFIERRRGSRIELTRFGRQHGGPGALGVLTCGNLAELTLAHRERSYRLTPAGLDALGRLREEGETLEARIRRELDRSQK